MAKILRGRLPPLMREALAEFMATFILVSFGLGSVAQFTLSRSQLGTFFSVNFSWGVAVTMGCYWAGGISGAHMNPAVTLALAVVRRLKWTKVPAYCLAQLLGAFLASTVVYGIYRDALDAFDGGIRQVTGPNATAGVFATYPKPFVTTANGFADQFFGTALLVSCIFAILDRNNNAPDQGVAPVMIGLVVFVIGTTFGLNCGYPINPARDLGPRIFTAMAGWGSEVFTAYNNWAWVPVIACPLGGVLGAIAYIITIEFHHSASADTEHPYEPICTAAARTEQNHFYPEQQ